VVVAKLGGEAAGADDLWLFGMRAALIASHVVPKSHSGTNPAPSRRFAIASEGFDDRPNTQDGRTRLTGRVLDRLDRDHPVISGASCPTWEIQSTTSVQIDIIASHGRNTAVQAALSARLRVVIQRVCQIDHDYGAAKSVSVFARVSALETSGHMRGRYPP